MADLATMLGYRPGTRIVIPHLDDVAVGHGANRAFVDLAGGGFVTTGSVMVPCPWFPEIAQLAKEQPELDLGVHLTLTSESRRCRWRPISTTARISGLIDPDGFMWPDVPALRRHARKGAVEAECRAQIETALAAGLDVTHLDTHMGAAAAPEFADIYIALGREYRLPVLLTRHVASYTGVLDLGPVDPEFYRQLIRRLDTDGLPLIDRFAMGLALRQHGCEQAYRQMVGEASPGVTYLSLHCSTPGEVERMHPSDGAWRIAEYELCREPGFLAWVADQDVELIGFRAIRDRYRATSAHG
jgi:chitin disaccharide deacetylase